MILAPFKSLHKPFYEQFNVIYLLDNHPVSKKQQSIEENTFNLLINMAPITTLTVTRTNIAACCK
jgi:hypothetical protein